MGLHVVSQRLHRIMAFFPVVRSAVDSSKKFFGLTALVVAAAILLAGCHQAVTDPNDPKFIVAEKAGAGGWQITESELEKEVTDYLKQNHATPEQVGPAKMPILRTAMLKNMVLRKLLLAKGAALQTKDADLDKTVNAEIERVKGATSEADFEAQLKTAGLTLDELKKRLREKALVQKVFEAEAFKNLDPTDQEINDIYLKNKESFNIPAKVRASRVLILVDDKTSPADKANKKKAIDKARARIAKGEDFGKVATEVSEDQYSKTRGGDLNFFQRGENPDAGFDDVAFNTKVGILSPVFETPLGYQFLKVTAIQPAGVVPVADARGYISSKLREMKMNQQEQDYAKKLLADPTVAYHITLIDPPAQTQAPNGPGAPDNAAPGDASAPPDAGQAPPPDQSQAPAPAPAPDQAQAPAAMPTPAPAPTDAAPAK
jgi:parvulin-like peptidyl-prolyl isomerase